MNNKNLNFSNRDAVSGVNKLFVQRWSPRKYLPVPVSEQDLETIFDAARWSPSCYNEQPWMFLTSTESTHKQFVSLLVAGNQQWAKNASVIGFMVAATTFSRNGNENYHAAFDTGAAWMAINLQASMLGLYVHGMGGIEYDAIYEQLNINSETHQVMCGFALGKLDTSGNEEITARKPLADIWRPFS
ncbi:MAG: nitroreductase family protein [Pseudomonadales bacterium]